MKKKNLLDYTNLLSPNDYKGMRKQYIITLRPHMTKENISLNKPFINKKLSVRRNEISHVNEKKNKKVCRALNYFKHFYIFISAVSVCVSLSAFVSLVGIPVDATRSAVQIRIWAITAGIRKYKSMIEKNRPYSLIRQNVNTINILISKTLSNSYISYDKFVSVNNVLREYNETKAEIKNPKNTVEYTI